MCPWRYHWGKFADYCPTTLIAQDISQRRRVHHNLLSIVKTTVGTGSQIQAIPGFLPKRARAAPSISPSASTLASGKTAARVISCETSSPRLLHCHKETSWGCSDRTSSLHNTSKSRHHSDESDWCPAFTGNHHVTLFINQSPIGLGTATICYEYLHILIWLINVSLTLQM